MAVVSSVIEALNEAGLSNKDISDRTGIERNRVGRMKRGTSKVVEYTDVMSILKLGAEHGVEIPVEEMVGPLLGDAALDVGVFGKTAAGLGTANEPRMQPEEWIQVPRALRVSDGTLIGLRVSGESMEPELSSGDVLIVHYPILQPAVHLLKGDALVVVTDDDWQDYIKRYHWNSDASEDTLVSTNPTFPSMRVPPLGKLRYIGAVRMIIKSG